MPIYSSDPEVLAISVSWYSEWHWNSDDWQIQQIEQTNYHLSPQTIEEKKEKKKRPRHMVLEKIHILTCSFFLNCVSVSSSYMNDVYYNFVCRVLLYVRHLTLHTYILYNTSVDTEMCCPKGKCGCQYFILLTLKKKNSWTQGSWIFLLKN